MQYILHLRAQVEPGDTARADPILSELGGSPTKGCATI
jgi:hypothetical protein